MRALLQRVKSAQVEVDGQTVGKIGQGLLAYLGVAVGDSPADGPVNLIVDSRPQAPAAQAPDKAPGRNKENEADNPRHPQPDL